MVADFRGDTLDIRYDSSGTAVGASALYKLGPAVVLVALETSRESTRVIGVEKLLYATGVRVALCGVAHDVVGPAVHACRSVAPISAVVELDRVIKCDIGRGEAGPEVAQVVVPTQKVGLGKLGRAARHLSSDEVSRLVQHTYVHGPAAGCTLATVHDCLVCS